jgi:peptidoglycan/LPS O-acetylase OafA/YrhL
LAGKREAAVRKSLLVLFFRKEHSYLVMTPPRHIPALDALRGVAVTLVIASHALPMAQNLPWTIKRFSNLGFFGVQLFFVVSSITLANSWRRSGRSRPPALAAFALRRIFRIAPAYFLAACAYAVLLPTGHCSPMRILTFLTFTNGWSPAQMPTVHGAWVGVPGGWSIEAEFGFYALFPILIVALRGLERAGLACLVSLPLAWVANRFGWAVYAPVYGDAATSQFLYYWLPNQLPVFLIGLAAYEISAACSPGGRWRRLGRTVAMHGRALCGASLCMFLLLAFTAWPRLPEPQHLFVPVHVLAALAFAVAAVALVARPWPCIVNRWVVAIGQASFSAYLLHFAVMSGLESLLPQRVLQVTGFAAALVGCVLFVAVFVLTSTAAQLTHLLIEAPGVRLGGQAVARIAPRAR